MIDNGVGAVIEIAEKMREIYLILTPSQRLRHLAGALALRGYQELSEHYYQCSQNTDLCVVMSKPRLTDTDRLFIASFAIEGD